MRQRGTTTTLQIALNQMMEECKLKGKMTEMALCDAWPELVGNMIARETSNLKLHNGRLLIELRNGAVRHELSYNKNVLIDLINQKFGIGTVIEINLA
ncbi:MAG: DUF721 domain-containing protein [Bacteroidota bacterium]|nr:DUF721 domain-containing protein [Bacteroidota bacterium]